MAAVIENPTEESFNLSFTPSEQDLESLELAELLKIEQEMKEKIAELHAHRERISTIIKARMDGKQSETAILSSLLQTPERALSRSFLVSTPTQEEQLEKKLQSHQQRIKQLMADLKEKEEALQLQKERLDEIEERNRQLEKANRHFQNQFRKQEAANKELELTVNRAELKNTQLEKALSAERQTHHATKREVEVLQANLQEEAKREASAPSQTVLLTPTRGVMQAIEKFQAVLQSRAQPRQRIVTPEVDRRKRVEEDHQRQLAELKVAYERELRRQAMERAKRELEYLRTLENTTARLSAKIKEARATKIQVEQKLHTAESKIERYKAIADSTGRINSNLLGTVQSMERRLQVLLLRGQPTTVAELLANDSVAEERAESRAMLVQSGTPRQSSTQVGVTTPNLRRTNGPAPH